MPIDEVGVGTLLGALRVPDRPTAAIQELPEGSALAVHGVGHKQPEAMGRTFETDRAAVEGPVVQDAKRQPVAHVVRSAVGVPTDVGRVKSYQVVFEPDVEVTDGASPLVRCQDGVAEFRVAGRSCS